ncbi:MAG: hypothetical protein L6N94_00245 [Candidatus Methylarchaceae archaeon HK01M]|nr:hypothetical protein [Candidatus Methylarchaceae archaeon HK01M]
MLWDSRLTEYANVLNDQQLKRFAGWRPNSSIANWYIFLSGRDINSKLLSAFRLDKGCAYSDLDMHDIAFSFTPRFATNLKKFSFQNY